MDKCKMWVFWVAGFLFTLGYVGIDPAIKTYSVSKIILIWILSYLLWPLVLGSELAP